MNKIEKILKELEKFNYIRFEPKYHSYFLERTKFKSSVTGKINQFKKPFDNEKWSKIKAAEYGITQNELKKIWSDKGSNSSHRGNNFHTYAEDFYTGIESRVRINQNLKNHFYRFNEDVRDRYIFICAEQNIGDRDLSVAGKPDVIFYDIETDEIVIGDWKTNIIFKSVSDYNLTGKLSGLNDSDWTIYSLQLHSYKLIIERNTDLKIGRLEIYHFGKYDKNYILFNAKDLRNYMRLIYGTGL